MRMIAILSIVLALTSTGCAKKMIDGATPATGETAKAGASLAYEHTVSVSIPESALKERLNAIREACADQRFGQCSLLRFEESSGSYPRGLIEVRVVPAAVEPMVGIASKEGRIGSRQTHAEDLAEMVADTTHQQAQLSAQRDKLVEFQNRKDLAVSDMVALAHELASVELQLSELDLASTRLNQRIETNLLTLELTTKEGATRWSNVCVSISDFLDSLADGTSEKIGMIAFGLPFLIVLFPLALVWRWLWRRATTRSNRLAR